MNEKKNILVIRKIILQIALSISCLLVCSLINTNFAFADVTCVLTPSHGNMVWQYILIYTLLLLYLMSYIKHAVDNLQSTSLGNLYGNNK